MISVGKIGDEPIFGNTTNAIVPDSRGTFNIVSFEDLSIRKLNYECLAKHTTVNDIFSRSSRSESKLGLLVKYTYTVLDSAMPFLVLKAKFRGEKSGERNLRTKAISVLVLILNSLAIVLRCKTKQEKPPRFL